MRMRCGCRWSTKVASKEHSTELRSEFLCWKSYKMRAILLPPLSSSTLSRSFLTLLHQPTFSQCFSTLSSLSLSEEDSSPPLLVRSLALLAIRSVLTLLIRSDGLAIDVNSATLSTRMVGESVVRSLFFFPFVCGRMLIRVDR